jgi:hypothetical protein
MYFSIGTLVHAAHYGVSLRVLQRRQRVGVTTVGTNDPPEVSRTQS